MKKHILSQYSEKISDAYLEGLDTLGKTTYETSTVEISDPDEFVVTGNTIETRVKEDSDPDEFRLESTSLIKTLENADSDEFMIGPTMLTEQVENSDPDEFVVMGPTKGTFSKEDSDPDEFMCGFFNSYYNQDFDELLLI